MSFHFTGINHSHGDSLIIDRCELFPHLRFCIEWQNLVVQAGNINLIHPLCSTII